MNRINLKKCPICGEKPAIEISWNKLKKFMDAMDTKQFVSTVITKLQHSQTIRMQLEHGI